MLRLAGGEQLTASRRFPFPFTYHISGVYGRGAANVPAATVASLVEAKLIDASLVEAKLIDASQPNAMADVILYRVTDAGRAFAKHPPPFDDEPALMPP